MDSPDNGQAPDGWRAKFACSPFCMRGFRISRGCSIGSYVKNCQMEQANALLASDESVNSIATLTFEQLAYDEDVIFDRSLLGGVAMSMRNGRFLSGSDNTNEN
jgi:hypothetical protein